MIIFSIDLDLGVTLLMIGVDVANAEQLIESFLLAATTTRRAEVV